MPITKAPILPLASESTHVKQATTPMLKDFPTLSSASIVSAAKTSPQSVKQETKSKSAIAPTPSTIASPRIHDAAIGYLAVVAFIIAVLSALILGAGYFDLL